MKEIVRIYGNSTSITFELEDVIIYANSQFRKKEDYYDGFILYANTLRYKNGIRLIPEERFELKEHYLTYIIDHDDIVDWDI